VSATNGDPGKTWQRLAARVRTPYGGRGPLRRPARRRVEWFADYRHRLIERHGLTDPQALTDAYDLAVLFTEWRVAAYELGQARRQQEEGQTSSPSVRTLQKRLGLARRDYVAAREGFEARWDGKPVTSGEDLLALRERMR
jgi:hypothetical protein